MTPETTQRIAEIEARLAAATPGPWDQWGDVADVDRGIDWTYRGICTCVGYDSDEMDCPQSDQDMANAVFIAHCPADLRYLLDELKRAGGE